jgi:hypothetical protein
MSIHSVNLAEKEMEKLAQLLHAVELRRDERV